MFLCGMKCVDTFASVSDHACDQMYASVCFTVCQLMPSGQVILRERYIVGCVQVLAEIKKLKTLYKLWAGFILDKKLQRIHGAQSGSHKNFKTCVQYTILIVILGHAIKPQCHLILLLCLCGVQLTMFHNITTCVIFADGVKVILTMGTMVNSVQRSRGTSSKLQPKVRFHTSNQLSVRHIDTVQSCLRLYVS